MKILASLLAATAGLSIAACSNVPTTAPMIVECTTSPAGERPGPALTGVAYGTRMTPIPLGSVQFDSGETAKDVAIQAFYASRTAADTVQLEVRMVSCSDKPRTVRARTSFMRAGGSPAEAPSAWQTLVLAPRALALYKENSIARDVQNYVVELAREP